MEIQEGAVLEQFNLLSFRDAKYIIKSATAGASTGLWVGAGCPLP